MEAPDLGHRREMLPEEPLLGPVTEPDREVDPDDAARWPATKRPEVLTAHAED